MKIQICSDLHLEFEKNRNWLSKNPLNPVGEILVIAGDTSYLGRKYEDMDFIKKVSDDFEAVYLIPGNHEYYGGYDISTALEPTYESILDNVFMVNNKVIELNGVNLIFSTMWSSVQNNVLEIFRGMLDFSMIKYQGMPFHVNHYNEIDVAASDFII